ncbi:MAG: ion transporter, partial [bacterium]
MDGQSAFIEKSWKSRLYSTIFDVDSQSGRIFEIILLIVILASVLTVVLESVSSVRTPYGTELRALEWIFTILFTLEYGLRLLSVHRPRRYAFSFFGVVDFLAFAPTYLSLIFAGTQVFLAVRALRLLRVFRIFKMVRYVRGAEVLQLALRASQPQITVFIVAVF